MIALYARNSPDEILTRVGLYVIPKADQSTHQNKSQTPPLIAAMRCYVASKLGDEVEVPDELT